MKTPTKKRRPGKYRAVRTVIDGITFASKKEAARYQVLKMLLKKRQIKNLRLQVPYEIRINGVLICKYLPDFVYIEKGKEIVEDVKGVITPIYRLKKKMMKAVFGIEILET